MSPPTHAPVYISFGAVSWAMGSDLTGLQRLALIELARHADAGGRCWPSMSTIARRLGTSTRWARSTIAQLERAGYLSRAQIAGKGAIFQLHMAAGAPFETPDPQFRGQAKTPEPQFRGPRNSSSGQPRNPRSAKQRALNQRDQMNSSAETGPNSRAKSSATQIRNPERYANAKLYYQLRTKWNQSDMGPIAATTSNAAAQKARICGRVETLLKSHTPAQLIQRIDAIIAANADGEYYIALDATLDDLINSQG